MWASHKVEFNDDGTITWIKIIPFWTEVKYKLIDLKRRILHQYKDVEYWECPDCLNKIKEKYENES